MSRKPRGKAKLPASEPESQDTVADEILAEGSGPLGAVVHVGIDTIGTADAEPALEEMATTENVTDDGSVESLADQPIEIAPAAGEAGETGVTAEPGATLPTSAASMDTSQLKHLVEALVFAADKPITVARLRQLTRVSDTRRLEQALVELAADYAERGLTLQQVSGGYQFRTRTQFSGWVQQLIAGRPVRLSRAQLETLAIIAYRQPITRPEIDEIRGVDSSQTLKLLIERCLIRILGKKEEVGRPMLYGTTREFLDFFSLGDLRELPTLREYSELSDESRQVMSDRLGIGLDDDDDIDAIDGDGGVNGDSSTPPAEPAEQESSLDELLAAYAGAAPDAPELDAEATEAHVEDLEANGSGVEPVVVPSSRAAEDVDR